MFDTDGNQRVDKAEFLVVSHVNLDALIFLFPLGHRNNFNDNIF